jgi:selenocysteine lyase/cysteine desulfurase
MRLYLEYREEWERLRGAFAAVVGAESDEVAITDNTSRGSNLIVQMIEAPPGSNVVLDDYTYQSSLYPWRLAAKAHVEIRVVRARDHVIDPADFVPLVDERTVALSVTHVSWQTGFRHELAALARLAHAHGAYLVVDAAQSAGALALDARALGVDFLVCGALKWLLGLPGVGFLYARREHVERLAVAQAGYAGVDRPATFGLGDDFAFKPGASRYELGLPSLPALAACREGIQLLLAVGLERVERHVLELSGYYLEGLARRGLRSYTPPTRPGARESSPCRPTTGLRSPLSCASAASTSGRTPRCPSCARTCTSSTTRPTSTACWTDWTRSPPCAAGRRYRPSAPAPCLHAPWHRRRACPSPAPPPEVALRGLAQLPLFSRKTRERPACGAGFSRSVTSGGFSR